MKQIGAIMFVCALMAQILFPGDEFTFKSMLFLLPVSVVFMIIGAIFDKKDGNDS